MEAKIWNKNGWVNEIDPTKLKNKYKAVVWVNN